jgi:hypothetical protein
MNHARSNNHLLLNFGMLFLAWTLYGVFFATQAYLRMTYYGRPGGWPDVLTAWLVCGYAWALLTPPALWLYRRFPFTLSYRFRFLCVHLPAAAVFAFIHLAIFVSAAQLIRPNPAGWFASYQNIVVEDFHADFLSYFAILAIYYGFSYFFRPREKKVTEDETAPIISADGQRAKPTYAERFSVRIQGRIILVDVNEIDSVTSEGNYVKLHTKDRSYLLRETMNAMEQKLDPGVFVRLRRSTMVRIEQIAEFHPLFNSEFEVILKNGAKHSSSRRYRKNLESLLKH